MKAMSPAALLVTLMMGLAMLTVSGCFGGSRNFSSSTDVPKSLPTPSIASSEAATVVGPKQGNQAPDFSLKDLNGNVVRLSDFRGKPVLVNFWATWCPPCKEEMPDLQTAYQKYKDQGYVFLGVDLKEDAGTVSAFVQQYKYGWTFLLDPDGQAARGYRVTGVPESFFIDRSGIVQDSYIGAISKSQLEAKLGKIK